MEPTSELVDALFAEKVRRARRTPISEKLAAGPRLFAHACETMRAGIRARKPNATPAEVELLLKDRLALSRKLEESSNVAR